MAQHAKLVETGPAVYFCDLHRAWREAVARLRCYSARGEQEGWVPLPRLTAAHGAIPAPSALGAGLCNASRVNLPAESLPSALACQS
jgi:hypothetical protein